MKNVLVCLASVMIASVIAAFFLNLGSNRSQGKESAIIVKEDTKPIRTSHTDTAVEKANPEIAERLYKNRPSKLTLDEAPSLVPTVTLATAANYMDKKVSLRFTIYSGFKSKSGKVVVLNTMKDYKSKYNLQVVLFTSKKEEWKELQPKLMKGKGALVVGIVGRYRDQNQLIAETFEVR